MDSRDEAVSNQDSENLAGENLEGESLSPKEQSNDEVSQERHTSDPLEVQKRLKQQKRAHEREMRELRAEMQAMREHSSVSANPTGGNQPINPYMAPVPEGVDENIHKAVSYALNHRDMEARKAKEAESQQHVAKKYQGLSQHLDTMGDKYDDFDETVRGNLPFTPHMRDTALLLPKKGPGSAGEVLYKLGKNPDELRRIGQLHPADQAEEMIRLSHALISGEERPKASDHQNALGSIKSNPVTNSARINENTSAGDIRRRMKAGTFK
jgi:hypothetical protein